MGRKYANPPLIEAVCEFRLTPDTWWDLTIPGLVYEKLRDEFPHREQRLLQETEFIRMPEGVQQQIRTSENIMFLTADRKMFVQIAARLFAVNCLKPYPAWTPFKSRIEKSFRTLAQIAEVKGLQKVGLRYINQIEMPTSPPKLEDYFQFYLSLGAQLPQDMTSFIAGCEFRYADGRDLCRLQLTTAHSGSSEHPILILDIDYLLAQPKGVGLEQAMEWVEHAHSRVEEIFEGSITDRLRELFQEVK